ncbi:hypothetical protein [Halomarina ordinaria]|uniref:Uncharacterized protein n=1 Tax=Halomarina ordinaria TaxID=3033939 RepID=A0ABD5U940_9EURY|nr:hypothetical protein [Halomarina sp. PSRA2]
MVPTADTRRFLLFFLASSLTSTRMGVRFAPHDRGATDSLDRVKDGPPRFAGPSTTTTDRTPSDDATDGDLQRFEHRGAVPPAVVRRGDRYDVFDIAGRFDCTNPRTLVPMLVGAGGIGRVLSTVGRDVVP